MASHRRPGVPFAPPEGRIERGTVVRIEPYGAFVQLENFRGRGLVHISELTTYKVESVDDAVSMDDVVWVKVLAVTETQDDQGKTRHKIQLSMKDASQEDGRDLGNGKGRQQKDAQSRALEQNLSSSIGMGVALDPMANYQSSSLVMKHERDRNKTLINGYALVGDEEGEPDPPPAKQLAVAPEPAKPMGRGRGMTLPAWMTATNQDGPVGERRGPSRSSSEESRRRDKKRRKKRDEPKESRRRKEVRKHRKHRRDSHKRRRRRSRSVSDDSREDRRGRGGRGDEKINRHSRGLDAPGKRGRGEEGSSDKSDSGSRGRGRSHRHRRRRSRSRSESKGSRGSSGSRGARFESVEDAHNIIARLESKKAKAGR